ncbi:MAG: Ig-like domain-containing protein [Gemmatimonadaceae bacterium]
MTWRSNRTTVATVDGTGLVTGIAAGAVTITATIDGKSGTSLLTVVTPPVSTVTVTPSSGDLFVSQTLQLAASTLDTGHVLGSRPSRGSRDPQPSLASTPPGK